MKSRNPELFSLILRLPRELQEGIDSTAQKLRMTRTDFIRKSINRNLRYCEDVELPLVESKEIQEVLDR